MFIWHYVKNMTLKIFIKVFRIFIWWKSNLKWQDMIGAWGKTKLLTAAGLELDEAHLEPRVLLLVRVQLPLPLLHVRRRLLQRRRQPRVVVLQRRKLHLPLLCIRRAEDQCILMVTISRLRISFNCFDLTFEQGPAWVYRSRTWAAPLLTIAGSDPCPLWPF